MDGFRYETGIYLIQRLSVKDANTRKPTLCCIVNMVYCGTGYFDERDIMSGKVISKGLFLIAFVLYLPLTGCGVKDNQGFTAAVMEMSDLAAIEETINPVNGAEEDTIEDSTNETASEGRNHYPEGVTEEDIPKASETREKGMDVETAWQLLKEACFPSSELNEMSYDQYGRLMVVTYRGEMEFSKRPCENVVFYDREEDDSHIFGCYLVFYEGGEVFNTSTRGWYMVNSHTGEVEFK